MALCLAALLPAPLAASATLPGGPATLATGPRATRVTTRAVGARGQGAYAITPERRALLDTIRFAEGTWRDGRPEGYRVLYGGGLFKGLSRHPEITVRRRYVSAAAGAYQFLPGTWREVSSRLGLRSFEPHNQDQAALHLIQRRRALQLFDQQGLGAEVMARLAPEWASLPARHGGSHYGQPVKSREELLRFYRVALVRARQQVTAT